MAKRRKAQRDITIPIPFNVDRRTNSLSDPIKFLRTYFAEIFFEDFTQDRLDIVNSIVAAALYGGDQAIAGPRGEGKTKLAIFTALYLMFSKKSVFPCVVGKSQTKAQSELKIVREVLQQNETLAADFPEVCVPYNLIGGWSSRARLQTVSGQLTNAELSSDHLIFPTIERDALPSNWPSDVEPVSCGQTIASIGIDGPIRGLSFRNQRPTIAIIDDIEDREAASSKTLIDKNIEIIEKDIAGLGASARRVSRVFLCTIQNRSCVAYTYTDPISKPSWRGRRYRKMIRPPDRMDLIEEYIRLRKMRTADDPDARIAFRYWKDNKQQLEDGCIVSNVASFDVRLHADGEQLELSAIQAYYNRVADVGEIAVATEIDNDPPEEAGPMGIGIDAPLVESRVNGLPQRRIPVETKFITLGIDLGKYRCYWVAVAWQDHARGYVVDYGVGEVTGTERATSNEAAQPMIYKALLNLREDFNSTPFIDPTGEAKQIDLAFVDSGTFTDVAYEFCKEVRLPYLPSKGLFPYREGRKPSNDLRIGEHLHAARMHASNVWLYELDTHYWKSFVHECFLTPTFDVEGKINRGSLSLYSPDGNHRHTSFAQHIVSEELVNEFTNGRGDRNFWVRRNRNNHWFDAMYMACAAGGALGVKLIAGLAETQQANRNNGGKESEQGQEQGYTKQRQRFIQRPGGWVPRRR